MEARLFGRCPLALLLLLASQRVDSCSYVRVSTNLSGDVIGRTMELSGEGSADRALNWTVSVHPSGELFHPNSLCTGTNGWRSVYSFVSVDLWGFYAAPIPSEGMNEHGLTVSQHTLYQSQYQSLAASKTPLCFNDLTSWVLGSFTTVAQVLLALQDNITLVQTGVQRSGSPIDSAYFLHWAVDDASGGHVVIEYVNGKLLVHDNAVGVLTNDPDFTYHLRHLNSFASLSQRWPDPAFATSTEIGAVPQPIGHGFDLMGLPGDSSPPSRFVRLFYLKQFATRIAPKSLAEGVSLAAALLSTIWIPKHTVAGKPKAGAASAPYWSSHSMLC